MIPSWCEGFKYSHYLFIFRSLLTADLEQKSIERIPVSVDNVVATTSDMHNGVIYWSDMDIKKIMRMEKGGGTPEAVIDSGLSLVEGLAYDWVSQLFVK